VIAFALVIEGDEDDDFDNIFVNRRPRIIKEITNDFQNLDELDTISTVKEICSPHIRTNRISARIQ